MLKTSLDEKLRPKTMKNLVLLDRVKTILPEPLNLSQNLMLYSNSAGVGKSSYCNLFLTSHDCLRINSSLKRGIDVVRDDIEKFCSTQSFKFTDRKKVVIFEEADNLTSLAFNALRSLIEQYHNNVIFICNLNYINKIPDAFRSRFLPINFDPISDEEERELTQKITKYLKVVCKKVLDIKFYDDDVLNDFISLHFPSIRNMLKQLQSFKESGIEVITKDNLKVGVSINDERYRGLFELIIDKKIDSVKTYQTIISTYTNRMNEILSVLSTSFIEWIISKNDKNLSLLIPNILIIVADETYKSNFVNDENLIVLSTIFRIKSLI